ncbi:hypothetical protein ZP13_15265 [Salmonella enterica subsp. enterica]|nr:hypothetical protein [Salmonella enterica]ECC3607227.1 hypothetical protein [Salmonella enterica subsp. enterica]EGI6197742.1 hypothetical protein [Salmonella enterica subsp. enterica serovar Eastbourne]ECE0939555.1 hypothetical protein [Salmonella enterica subsp. enterica]ECH9416560.1 hypothetical protein [Salmonella enterica subsp. enterica]
MKIAINNITHDDSHVKGTVSVEHGCLMAPGPLCCFFVSVDYVEGKSLEQYSSDLKETALDIIKMMHDELIADNAGNISSTWSVKLNENGCITTGNAP